MLHFCGWVFSPHTTVHTLLLYWKWSSVEENPIFSSTLLSGNFGAINSAVPLWRNGMAVFWYGKHGHWLCSVNTSA